VPVDIVRLLQDLSAETDLLLESLNRFSERLNGAGEGVWDRPTPAPGWTVRDQVTHLAYFDDVAVLAALDPGAFNAGKHEALADVDAFTTAVARRYSSLDGHEVLEWFDRARAELISVYSTLDPGCRVPWYGPDMSPASAVTARLMETWAHGQDVIDGTNGRRSCSPGLRHVAHLGVRTLPNSFRARGRPVPQSPVRVELTVSDGELWEWGPPGVADQVRGPALDFCLVVTQRRHIYDTRLATTGPVAREWMSIAQAFAGPPGAGRRAGQFPT
jgi:uncharacterized protein (TIGR03084 family)